MCENKKETGSMFTCVLNCCICSIKLKSYGTCDAPTLSLFSSFSKIFLVSLLPSSINVNVWWHWIKKNNNNNVSKSFPNPDENTHLYYHNRLFRSMAYRKCKVPSRRLRSDRGICPIAIARNRPKLPKVAANAWAKAKGMRKSKIN